MRNQETDIFSHLIIGSFSVVSGIYIYITAKDDTTANNYTPSKKARKRAAVGLIIAGILWLLGPLLIKLITGN